MRLTSTCFFRNTAIVFSALFLFFSLQAGAQTAEHGRESASATVNFAAMAAYYAAHPDTPRVMILENDEDEDERPPYPKTTDSTMIRFRATRSAYSSSSATTFLPVSPSAIDTFSGVPDNNTSIPPDTHGDVDSNYCVTAINTSVRIQSRSGATVSTVSLSNFFLPILPGGGAFDPRIIYDPYAKRWYLIADANSRSDSNILLIAISQTSNPTGSWYEFRVIMDAAGTSWLDYPTVGYNKKWITVGGNRFLNSGGYKDARVLAFNKASLLAGSGAPYTAFTYTTSFTISPAITYDSSMGNMFAVESWDGNAGQMRLWKLSGNVGSESFTSVGFPATSTKWQFSSFNFSGTAGDDFAPQSGTSNKMQTNDDRVYDCKYMNGTVWCSHNVFLPYSTSVNAQRCSIQWWQIDTAANPIQMGLIDDPSNTNFYYFPAISVNKYNDALIGFSTSSAATHVNAAYTLHLHTDPTDSMRPLNIYRHGLNTYYKTFSGTKNRWGDYSNSSVDPLNLTDFWTLQEVAGATADRWDTWWARVKVCVQPPALITPASATTFCTGGSVVLNATTGTGFTYQWQVGGTDIAGATTASYTANTAGSYRVHIYDASCDSLSPAVTVTVNTTPSAGTITGTASACVGSTTTLSNATTGGVWSTTAAATASVNTTGVVTGVAAGTATISYTVTNACGSASTSRSVTINPLPTVASISGTTSVCVGGTTTLTNSTAGGVWTSGATGVATVSTTGTVTGVSAGSAIISYTVTNGFGCVARATATVTVNTGITATVTPAGPTTFCTGGSVVLNASTGTGYTYQWQLGTTNITGATNSSYTANAAGAYRVIITSGACAATSSATTVTVNTVYAAAIAGATSVCVGATATVTDSTTGGTWTSGSTSIATINSSGIITGVAAGSAVISYSVTNACGTATVTRTITVNAPTTVAAIAGATAVCAGGVTTLTDATAGGVWSSGSTGIATVSATGVVTGVSVGTAAISYTVTNSFGCISRAVANVTVTSGITATVTAGGATTFCTGGSVVLTATSGSGYTYQWQSGTTNITGATNISYTANATGNYRVIISSGGCVATSAATTVTVNSAYTAAIAGATSVCIGATATVTDSTTGGTWTSGSTSIATISSTGVITGVAAGTAVISYSATGACGTAVVTRTITVNSPSTVAAITGGTAVCSGGTITLADATAGGVWSSGNVGVATISTTGVVTGVSVGTAPITYTLTNSFGCVSRATTSVTITSGISASISAGGATTFCTGGSVTLTATSGSGYTYQWQVGGTNISGATSSSYTATSAGVYNVSITQGSCTASSSAITVTVLSSTVAAISGASAVCTGASTTLTDATTGGVWVSSSTVVATVSTTGVVTGVAAGTATISYIVVNACGTATATRSFTVAAPTTVAAITGSLNVCPGNTTALSDATTGGTWSSSSTSVASISATGVVTGLSTGTSIITYSVTNAAGCVSYSTASLNVLAPPSATITPSGSTTFCSGAYVILIGNVGSGLTYQWKTGGVAIAGATNSSYTATASGNITVVVTNAGGCSTTSAATTITVTSGTVVVPSVTVNATPGFVLCTSATADTFTAVPVNGGSSPAYQWYVNGAPTATTATMSYTPTSGDVVRVRLTSNAACAFPDTASYNSAVTISGFVAPGVGINPFPNDTVCSGILTTFTAVPVNGGSAPTYTWKKNGTNVFSGAVYAYLPADNDVIVVTMHSNFPCRTSDSAVSSPVTMSVDTSSANTVSITANHSVITAGQAVTFVVAAPHAGAFPTYQWLVNGLAVPGATNTTYTTTILGFGQVVTCRVVSSENCATPNPATSNGIVILIASGVETREHVTPDFTLVPNPNNGSFFISGTMNINNDDKVTIKVSDMIGRDIYSTTALIKDGRINERISLDRTLASGMYIVNIVSTEGSFVMRMVLNK